MRISIYTPSGILLETIKPVEESYWDVEQTNDRTKIRLKRVVPGHYIAVTDRLDILGPVIVIIQEQGDKI
jgi:hypothetical protein